MEPPPSQQLPESSLPPIVDSNNPVSHGGPEFNLTEFLTQLTSRITETINFELIQSFFNQDSILSKWIVTGLSIVLTLVFVCAFVAFGWWIVWICFLSRFKFVRELLLGNNTATTPSEDSPAGSSSSSPSSSSTSRNKRPKRKTRTD